MKMGTEEKLNKSIFMFYCQDKVFFFFFIIIKFLRLFVVIIELDVVKSVISYECIFFCWFPLPFMMMIDFSFVE